MYIIYVCNFLCCFCSVNSDATQMFPSRDGWSLSCLRNQSYYPILSIIADQQPSSYDWIHISAIYNNFFHNYCISMSEK